MSKRVEFNTDSFDCEMEVQCTVEPEFYQNMQPNGMSERCPAQVEDLYVGIIIRGTAIDITDRLPAKVLERIKDECIKQAEPEDDGGPDPDRDRD